MKLTVEKFSCIRSASIELSGLNILIGPQASGKSVLSKLIYFMLDLHRQQTESIMSEMSFDAFCEEFKLSFCELFPISAWGSTKFKITFKSNDFEVRLSRGSYNEEVRDSIRLGMSASIKDMYKNALDLVKSSNATVTKDTNDQAFASFEIKWKLRQQISNMLQKQFPDATPSPLTFIPAGRSFFTNLGKAFLAFDQGRLLDPITVRFGRLYSNLIGGEIFIDPGKSLEIVDDLAQILGGQIHRQGERITIRCADGREIPLAALSSGQQELLPLFLTFNFLNSSLNHRPNKDKRPEITIIEEPEAHLFPSAQSLLLQSLVGYLNAPQSKRQLILTTHSPYVLSKINNLIKAGELEKKIPKTAQTSLNSIIPKRARLGPGTVRAYAIIDQVATSIIDSDGLIAADYLDDISNEIGEEFSKLLSLEFSE
jgi:AAA15 family ATPase/GTPase